MIKVLLVSVAAVMGMTSVADAQMMNGVRTHKHKRVVAPNGRCGGISYGTGARSCGTKSGGPVGGNSSRN